MYFAPPVHKLLSVCTIMYNYGPMALYRLTYLFDARLIHLVAEDLIFFWRIIKFLLDPERVSL
jgi:hypothetical protein